LAVVRRIEYVWIRMTRKHDLDVSSNSDKPIIWTTRMCIYNIYILYIVIELLLCVVISLVKNTYLERIEYFFCYYYYITYHIADDLFYSKVVIEVFINGFASTRVIILSYYHVYRIHILSLGKMIIKCVTYTEFSKIAGKYLMK